ncbi:uncharacterized protein LOC142540064 [Primulina tabacum]|uniref:uncharacterized protein LOC142540064 n=1 Tax=Primulina tabacum TaxID=48773 RepID=UPI003F596838
MGLGNSGMRSSPSPRSGSHKLRRRFLKRALSSLIICGASSSSRSPDELEDHPAEPLVNSSGQGIQEKFSAQSKGSNISRGIRTCLMSIKNENRVSSVNREDATENPTLRANSINVEHRDKGKYLSESKESVPYDPLIINSRGNEFASTSYVDQPCPNCVTEKEKASMIAFKGINSSMNEGSSQVSERLSYSSSLPSRGHEEFMLDEALVQNNVHEADFSSSEFGSSSVLSDSPIDFQFLRNSTIDERVPSDLGFLVSEREQNQQDESLLHVDIVSTSSNMSSRSSEISSQEARRNSRRLFWDAFTRRNSSGDFFSDELGGDFRSSMNTTRGGNEQQWHSRSELWSGSVDSINHRMAVCSRGIHADGSCSCHPGFSAEESGSSARSGISQIVMLAEALFEVLDQIHQQPMSLSLSMVSLPAPESVVDSFPVKTQGKSVRSQSEDDVTQCYICLAEYEEGDKIRVLPCQHEYHISCVDKWLKEIHGVCPLCRGDVREGFTEISVSN